MQSNLIGTDATGTNTFSNTSIALDIGGDANIIGGAPGLGNVITNANDFGIVVKTGSDNNQISHNHIGTDVSNTLPLGNGFAGIYFTSGTGNQILNNTIAKSGLNPDDPEGNYPVYRAGIAIVSDDADSFTIQNNFIGTNENGDANLGNAEDGIYLDDADNITIQNNVIAGNAGSGINLSFDADNNSIKQNGIGTNLNGDWNLGNAKFGIMLYVSSDNIVGAPYEGNRVANNQGAGIRVLYNGSDRNKIQANTIYATQPSATFVLDGEGILVNGGLDNQIGGINYGEANEIFNNQGAGVAVESSTLITQRPERNFILGNAIYENGGLGIRYFGIDPDGLNYPAPVIASWTTTPEDDGGGGGDFFSAAGAQAKQAKNKKKAVKENNSPDERGAKANKGKNKKANKKNKKQIASAAELVDTQNGTTNISGTFDGAPDTTYRIEYFANNACDTSNNGEGETLIGFENITTDGSGHFNLNATLSVNIPQDAFVTATATSPDNNTSVFSNCKATVQLVVNDNGDAADANVGDGTCATAGGVCTLRAAIQEANANAAPDKITFNISYNGVPNIQPLSELPTITAPVTIDGTSQPDANWIELDGSQSGNQKDGLEISAGNSTIKGLVINRFGAYAIHLTTNGNNTIIGNRIGTDITGTTFAGNAASIWSDDAPNNIIGGTNFEERNLFANSIWLNGANGGGNSVRGNYFGTDVNGATAFGAAGVNLTSPDNTIGGTEYGARNIILSGVHIESDNNIVQGNYIGTDATGMNGLNFGNGIEIQNGSYNLIGGDSDDARNVIANVGVGVKLNASADEIITNNQIINNYIGVKANGTEALGNTSAGILIEAPQFTNTQINNTVIRNNVIANSGLSSVALGEGIHIERAAQNTIIQGNKIGTDKNGTLDFGNREAGIYLKDATNTKIGGTNFGEGNVISGNYQGIYLDIDSNANTIQGNLIGVNANGDTALANEHEGIFLSYAGNNQIGGTTPEAANIISGNGGNGITLSDIQTEGNIVQGNYIGTNSNGANLGNGGDGILTEKIFFGSGAINNFIGGAAAGQGNTIAFNQYNGVTLGTPFNPTRGNVIHSNGSLGIDVSGNSVDTDLPSIFTAYFENGALEISGGRATSPGGTYGLDVFANGSCDSSGFGEGETYLGSMDIELDDNGIFDATFPANLSNGAQLTLTFTGSSTEEFSECLQLSAPSYVSNAPNCNGNNPCYATLTDAIAQVTRGSVIIVQGGTYTENVSINRQVGVYFTGDVTINGSLDMGSAFVKGTSGSLTVTGNVNTANAHFVHNNGTFVFNGGGGGQGIAAEAINSAPQTFTGNAKFYNVVVGENTVLDAGASSFRVQGTFTNNGAVQNSPAAQMVNDATTVTFKDALKNFALALSSNGAQGLGETTVTITRGVSPSACGAQNFPTGAVERVVNITPSNQTDVSATLRIYFAADEANGLNLNQLVMYHCNGTMWEPLTGTYVRDSENGLNYIEITGVNAFSPFGIGNGAPTAITLLSSKAKLHKKNGVVVKWETGSELSVVGFNIHRSTKRNGEYKLITKTLKQAKSPGEPNGNRYSYRNKKVQSGKTYFYKIEIVKADGTSEWSEPIKIQVP